MSLVQEWKKHDPLLSDLDGFQRFVERHQRFQELYVQLTTWYPNGGGPKEIKKYRRIGAVFASPSKDDPLRYSGLSYVPVSNLVAFEGLKKKCESWGDLFLCFDVMHEENLDHDPDRPHIKGTFCKYTYYDYDWQPIPKPDFLKQVEQHLNRVSRWYDRGLEQKGVPYPAPPFRRAEDEHG